MSVADVFEVNLNEVIPVACFGAATGEIALTIVGGVAPFEITWSHDSDLNTAKASNLTAGLYSVMVKDQLGCVQELKDIEVSEPALLELLAINMIETSCFGKADGVVEIQVVGGTPPFTLAYQGTNTFRNELRINGLARGSYAWEVVDAGGCILPISFEINSPEALILEVQLKKPACPGESNGALFVSPEGGNGPYFFLWNYQAILERELIGAPKGEYEVAVTDGSGCVSLGTGEITEKAPEVRMPSGFRPSSDFPIFEGVSNCEINYELVIYNRWGQLIYSGKTGWDGTLDGKMASPGTYSYQMVYSFVLEGEFKVIEKRGTFTLIR